MRPDPQLEKLLGPDSLVPTSEGRSCGRPHKQEISEADRSMPSADRR